jgi:hypothetical protein
MTVQLSEQVNAKPRKRAAVKTAGRQSSEKVKSTIHLTLEASQRLTVHAAMMSMDRSELVEQLIRENLKRFVVSDRGGASEVPVPPDANSSAN